MKQLGEFEVELVQNHSCSVFFLNIFFQIIITIPFSPRKDIMSLNYSFCPLCHLWGLEMINIQFAQDSHLQKYQNISKALCHCFFLKSQVSSRLEARRFDLGWCFPSPRRSGSKESRMPHREGFYTRGVVCHLRGMHFNFDRFATWPWVKVKRSAWHDCISCMVSDHESLVHHSQGPKV